MKLKRLLDDDLIIIQDRYNRSSLLVPQLGSAKDHNNHDDSNASAHTSGLTRLEKLHNKD